MCKLLVINIIRRIRIDGSQNRFELELLPKLILHSSLVVVVVLPDPFRGMGTWKNSTETQQSGHAPTSEPEVKNGRNSPKDGAPQRRRFGAIQKRVS